MDRRFPRSWRRGARRRHDRELLDLAGTAPNARAHPCPIACYLFFLACALADAGRSYAETIAPPHRPQTDPRDERRTRSTPRATRPGDGAGEPTEPHRMATDRRPASRRPAPGRLPTTDGPHPAATVRAGTRQVTLRRATGTPCSRSRGRQCTASCEPFGRHVGSPDDANRSHLRSQIPGDPASLVPPATTGSRRPTAGRSPSPPAPRRRRGRRARRRGLTNPLLQAATSLRRGEAGRVLPRRKPPPSTAGPSRDRRHDSHHPSRSAPVCVVAARRRLQAASASGAGVAPGVSRRRWRPRARAGRALQVRSPPRGLRHPLERGSR